MKRQLISAFIISIVACTGMGSAQEFKGPKIEVREMQHDFGKVTQGQQADYVFTVRNAGNEPLIIDRVVPS
jgi:uncharacterized membrane protein